MTRLTDLLRSLAEHPDATVRNTVGAIEAELSKQEPVVWKIVTVGGRTFFEENDPSTGYSQEWLDRCQSVVPLYTTAPPPSAPMNRRLPADPFTDPEFAAYQAAAQGPASAGVQSPGAPSDPVAAAPNVSAQRAVVESVSSFNDHAIPSAAEAPDTVRVPREPTPEMIEAGWIDKEDTNPDEIYRAMIAAAPKSTP